jgi:hypothetical protein
MLQLGTNMLGSKLGFPKLPTQPGNIGFYIRQAIGSWRQAADLCLFWLDDRLLVSSTRDRPEMAITYVGAFRSALMPGLGY